MTAQVQNLTALGPHVRDAPLHQAALSTWSTPHQEASVQGKREAVSPAGYLAWAAARPHDGDNQPEGDWRAQVGGAGTPSGDCTGLAPPSGRGAGSGPGPGHIGTHQALPGQGHLHEDNPTPTSNHRNTPGGRPAPRGCHGSESVLPWGIPAPRRMQRIRDQLLRTRGPQGQTAAQEWTDSTGRQCCPKADGLLELQSGISGWTWPRAPARLSS